MAEMKANSLLPGYISTVTDQRGKERYLEKLRIIHGVDPYEIPKSEWIDDVDLWPAVTYIHVGMYLLLGPSPYSSEDLLNYKSLASYVNFISGWVRQVLVKVIGDKRVLIAKVSS